MSERRPFPDAPILRDRDLDERFRTDGYCVVDVGEAAVDRLEAAVADLGPTPGDPGVGCHSSFLSSDGVHKRRVAAVVASEMQPIVDAHLVDHRVLLASLITKWPGPHSGFGFHQDLTFVDESRHSSMVLWVPLRDVGPESGPLWFVPGSHRWRLDVRGLHGVPFAFEPVVERLAERHSRSIEVSRGQAVVFDNAVVHASTPNRTDLPRTVAFVEVVPRDVTVVQHFALPDGEIVEVEIVDDRIFYDGAPLAAWAPPEGPDRVFRDAPRPMDHAELDDLLAAGLLEECDGPGPGPVNRADARCARCGGDVVDLAPPSLWIGNVTLLCSGCRAAESPSSAPA